MHLLQMLEIIFMALNILHKLAKFVFCCQMKAAAGVQYKERLTFPNREYSQVKSLTNILWQWLLMGNSRVIMIYRETYISHKWKMFPGNVLPMSVLDSCAKHYLSCLPRHNSCSQDVGKAINIILNLSIS